MTKSTSTGFGSDPKASELRSPSGGWFPSREARSSTHDDVIRRAREIAANENKSLAQLLRNPSQAGREFLSTISQPGAMAALQAEATKTL